MVIKSKFYRQIDKYDKIGVKMNFVPMSFSPWTNDKKLIFMKMARSAGTSIWRHSLKPYIKKIGGWSGGQGGSKDWLKSLSDEEILNDYFIFIFVRNPFDRVVSWFNHTQWRILSKLTGEQLKNFFDCYVKETFLDNKMSDIYMGHLLPSSTHCEYDESGELFVDFIGRFENLDEDWSKFCKIVKIPQTSGGIGTMLPKSNRNKTKEQKHYRYYYTDELVDIVANYYKRDLEMFNYEF
tara:strand:+ start:478 stop:1191 length:714 start_codon:yes stop_codon:yes gene_type:complete